MALCVIGNIKDHPCPSIPGQPCFNRHSNRLPLWSFPFDPTLIDPNFLKFQSLMMKGHGWGRNGAKLGKMDIHSLVIHTATCMKGGWQITPFFSTIASIWLTSSKPYHVHHNSSFAFFLFFSVPVNRSL